MAADDALISPGEPTTANVVGPSRTALVSIAAAALLVVLKLGTGILTGSLGLISAGIESSGDVVAAVLTFLAIRLGGRPPDSDHPYGHRRAENLGALGEGAILTGGGVFIVTEAIGQLRHGTTRSSRLVRLRRHWRRAARRRVPLIVVSGARPAHTGLQRCAPTRFTSPATWQARSLSSSASCRRRRVRGRRRHSGPRRCLHHLRRRRATHLRERARADGHRAHRRPSPRRAGHLRPRRSHRPAAAASARVRWPLLRRRRHDGPARPGHRRGAQRPPTAIEAAVREALPDTDVVVHLEPRRDGLDLRDAHSRSR